MIVSLIGHFILERVIHFGAGMRWQQLSKPGACADAVHYLAKWRHMVEYREKRPGERREYENKDEQTGAESQMQQVSVGLRGVLGMEQWRKEHPKATWQEIEAAVGGRVNQLQAQLI